MAMDRRGFLGRLGAAIGAAASGPLVLKGAKGYDEVEAPPDDTTGSESDDDGWDDEESSGWDEDEDSTSSDWDWLDELSKAESR